MPLWLYHKIKLQSTLTSCAGIEEIIMNTKKSWKILFLYFLWCLFSIPNEKSLKLYSLVKQIAHLHLGEYKYFPFFFTILASSLNDFMAYFSRIVFIPCFRLHVQICVKAWCAMVLLIKQQIKAKWFAETVSYRWKVIFLKRLVVFYEDPWNRGGFFCEIVCGVVISFDVLEVLASITLPDIYDRLKTYKEICVKLGFFTF